MYASISPDSLLKALEPVTTLVDEAKLHVTPEGIHTKAVDPANVGMVEMSLKADEFEKLDTNELVLGVNLTRFISQINNIADEPVGDEEQTLHLDLNEESRRVSMWAEPGSMEFTMALIDPDSIREEPDIPDMELPGQVEVMSSYFDHAVTTADNFAEHITLGMNDEDNAFYMSAEGDTDNWEAVLNEDHHAVHSLSPADAQSIYSLDYFNDVRKGIPADAPITMDIGNEFPVRMQSTFLDSNATVQYMIAPRIEDDG